MLYQVSHIRLSLLYLFYELSVLLETQDTVDARSSISEVSLVY